MKHLIAMMAAAGLVLGAGCGGNGSPEGPSAETESSLPRAESFRIAVPDFAPFDPAIRQEWEAVKKATGSGLQLEVAPMSYGALHEELFDRGGLAEGRFDAVLLHSDWLAQARQAKVLSDLAPRLHKSPPDDYPGDWTDDLRAAAQFDDQVLGLPYYDGLLCLIYRKDMFEDDLLRRVHLAKYDYAMKPPETWPDLERLAVFLNRPEYEMYGTALPAKPGGPGPFWVIAAEVWSRGGCLFDDKGLHFNTPEAQESLASYGRLVKDRYAVHRDVREMDLFDVGRTFAQGGLVMAVAPVGFAAQAQLDPASGDKGPVGVAPLPRSADQPAITAASCWVLAVPQSGPNQDLAYRFAKHCAAKQADKDRTLAGVLGTRKSTWADPQVRTALPLTAELESLHAAARALPQRADLPDLAERVNQAAIAAIDADVAPAAGKE